MIYYWLHVVYIFIGSRFIWKKVKPGSDLKRTRRVNLLDCEAFRFMANSKYFYYMDLIRFEVVFRSKLYENTIKKGMFGVLASQKIIYKKPLRRLKKFEITLIFEGADDKWVYHRQTFTQNNQLCAIGFTKAGFWKNKKAQNIKAILIKSGIDKTIKAPSKEVMNLFKNDYDMLQNNLC
ncbi:thioesterase family protein [Gaetbulibacter sp. M240]|uniref:thioesterase family protein n=1 Tax=Gaetbulibacter sp. M240 TaxID=3126511 RepID=UPI00374F33C0